MRPRDVLREAGLNLTEAEFLDLEGHEPYLLAFLVARKFARVKPRFPKAGLVREFGAGESEDFLGDFAAAARSVGLRKVEVLVERTPVLANHYCSVPEGEFNKYIQDGLDLRVAGGTGKDAGREIFLPRVREFARDAEGRLSVTPGSLPLSDAIHVPRRAHRDGRDADALCAHAGARPGALPTSPRGPARGGGSIQNRLRRTARPRRSEHGRHRPRRRSEAAGRHLEEIFAGTIAAKIATGRALARSGSLSLVADGINAFIDGPGAATMRLLSNPDLGEALDKIVRPTGATLAELATEWGSGLVDNLKSTMTGLARRRQEAREIATSAQRFYAWGVEEIVEIDHLFAAQRLERLLRFPEKAEPTPEWGERVGKNDQEGARRDRKGGEPLTSRSQRGGLGEAAESAR